MKVIMDEVEDTIIRALDHAERREMLRIISLSEKGASYTEIMGQLGLPTGKLNYQLRQLEGLIEKNEERRYALTPLGKKAVALLSMINQDINTEFEEYVKAARQVQKSRLQPLARSLILGLIAMTFIVLAGWSFLAYVLLTEGGPLIVYILLPILMALGVGFLVWLIRAFKAAPDILSRIESKIAQRFVKDSHLPTLT